jgi:hypothetical protein
VNDFITSKSSVEEFNYGKLQELAFTWNVSLWTTVLICVAYCSSFIVPAAGQHLIHGWLPHLCGGPLSLTDHILLLPVSYISNLLACKIKFSPRWTSCESASYIIILSYISNIIIFHVREGDTYELTTHLKCEEKLKAYFWHKLLNIINKTNYEHSEEWYIFMKLTFCYSNRCLGQVK